MKAMYSMRSPAVKRLMKEAQELREPTELYFTQPLEDNLFEWHFTIRGPENSDFDGGIYHGRIVLPPDYPMKPPNVILLTPNGRFETNKKICLSISGHHPESWQPSWSIRTALLAIIGFMPTHGGGAIGSLDYPTEERKKLAKRSVDWKCENCGSLTTALKPVTEASKATNEEAKELASQINFRGEKSPTENKTTEETSPSSTNTTPISTPPNTPVNQTFPNISTVPGQFPNLSAVPGQFPFPAFPFPPQFTNMQQQHQQGSNFVPRFPYPPQFLSSMFPHMPFRNPINAVNQNSGASDLTQESLSPQSLQSPVNSNSEVSNVESKSTESSIAEPLSQNSQSTGSVAVDSNESDETESASLSPSASNMAFNQPETLTSQPDISSGLRQRVYGDRVHTQDRTEFVQYADYEPEPRQSGLRLSTVLIVILLIGIVFLVFRRFYLQRMWRLPF